MTTAVTAALVGMLAAVATPAAAGAGLSLAAAGTQAAVAGAGAGLSEVVAEASARVEGESSKEIFESFLDNVEKIRSGMDQSTGRGGGERSREAPGRAPQPPPGPRGPPGWVCRRPHESTNPPPPAPK
ncbi:hypothetical protein ACFXPA_42325, partial [Amycolatopsis sp. NPDC059090]